MQRVLIVVEGGMVQEVITDTPELIEVFVLDHDNDMEDRVANSMYVNHAPTLLHRIVDLNELGV